MSPHGGGLYYCRASLGIIDALLAVLRCFRGVPCLSVCFRLSERTRVFAQPLVSPTGTPTGHLQGHIQGHLQGHTDSAQPLRVFEQPYEKTARLSLHGSTGRVTSPHRRAYCLSGFRNKMHFYFKKACNGLFGVHCRNHQHKNNYENNPRNP